MYFLTHLFRVCYFSTLVKFLSGYLLFAANFEDFQTIAKKLGTENFGKTFIRNPGDKGDGASYEGDDYARSFEINPKSQHSQHKKDINSKFIESKIDFDELVERVKKRIEKELREKYNIQREPEIKATNNNKKEIDANDNTKLQQDIKIIAKETSPIDYDTEEVEEVTDSPEKSFDKNEGFEEKLKQTTKAIVEEKQSDYADATIEITTKQKLKKEKSTYNDEFSFETVTYTYTDDDESKNQDIRTTKSKFMSKEVNSKPYKTIHMSKKDSYEDYKIPEKESNIYSSEERKQKKPEKNEKRFIIKKQNRNKVVTKDVSTTNTPKNRNKKQKLKTTTPNDDDFVESAEIKAKTEHANDFDGLHSKENTKRHKYATNIPRRERYKAITPNYYEKLPTVVEKYDFNEPLPERDREPENLKHFRNPPASINKKVRLL